MRSIERCPHHRRAGRWLDILLTGDEPVGLAWMVVLGFLRLTTNPRVMSMQWNIKAALSVVKTWYAHLIVSVVDPGPEHWSIQRHMLLDAGTGGNITADAHLAARSVERGATLHSADADFSRFRTLRWMNPIAVE